jgi:hypothetical protein
MPPVSRLRWMPTTISLRTRSRLFPRSGRKRERQPWRGLRNNVLCVQFAHAFGNSQFESLSPADRGARRKGGVDTAARVMGLHIQTLDTNTSAEIDVAFKAFGRERPDAVFVPTSPFFNGRR